MVDTESDNQIMAFSSIVPKVPINDGILIFHKTIRQGQLSWDNLENEAMYIVTKFRESTLLKEYIKANI